MADVLTVRNEYRLQRWMEIIRERQESGLSNKAFCTQRGISEKTYYYWLRKIRTAATEVLEPQLVRLEEPERAEADSKIHIRYGEAELSLPEDVDLEAVTVLLNALRRHDRPESCTELLCCLWLHGPSARDRRTGKHSHAAIRNVSG